MRLRIRVGVSVASGSHGRLAHSGAPSTQFCPRVPPVSCFIMASNYQPSGRRSAPGRRSWPTSRCRCRTWRSGPTSCRSTWADNSSSMTFSSRAPHWRGASTRRSPTAQTPCFDPCSGRTCCFTPMATQRVRWPSATVVFSIRRTAFSRSGIAQPWDSRPVTRPPTTESTGRSLALMSSPDQTRCWRTGRATRTRSGWIMKRMILRNASSCFNTTT